MSLLARCPQTVLPVVVVVLAACIGLPAHAQDPSLSDAERKKLDGELQFLLDRASSAKTGGPPVASLPSLSSVTMKSNGTPRYRVIIQTRDPAVLRRAGIPVGSVVGRLATARVTESQLRALAQIDAVTRVNASRQLHPHNDEAARAVGARTLNAGAVNNTSYKGQGVITCIIDTGLDYDHGDFANPDGSTRILRLWDQPDRDDSTGTGHPNGFSYGAEYTATEINNDNVAQEDTDGHGTHVAGTAASSGNALVRDGTQSAPEHRGMAPQSDLVIVKSNLSTDDAIDAMNYCGQVASNEDKPVVVNMSFGTDRAPHDGTTNMAEAIDGFTNDGTAPGKVVVASAGNSGRPGAAIHTSRSLGSGNTSTEPWTVESYSDQSGTVNDYFATEFWIDGTNDLQVVVTYPGDTYSDTLNAVGTSKTSAFQDTTDGAVYLESSTSTNSGDRYVLVQVFDNTESQPPAEGTWDITITNNGPSSTTYHGWTYTSTIPGNFDDGNNSYSVGSPATAASAISVGAHVHRWRWSDTNDDSRAYDGSSDSRDDIAAFSSRGPLRDGTMKPDLTAPGQGMISALSQDKSNAASSVTMPEGKHWMLKGTSMSAPAVTGSVALLLQEDESLTASQIKDHLQNSATVDDAVRDYGSVPNTTFGAGKLNALGAMTDLLGGTTEREMLSYEDDWTFSSNANQTVGGSGADKVALRFTPTQDGFVTGALLHLGTAPANNLTDPLTVEVWSDDGSGTPDTKLGGTQVAPDQLLSFSPNAVGLSSPVEVVAGTDYHLVVAPQDGSEEIDLGYETAGSASGRSQVLGSGSWSGLGGDLIIRPEVARTGGVESTLPVELAAFSGTANGSSVTLTWSTASETNNAGFRLQHKEPDADSFTQTAFIEGRGTTADAHTYRHALTELAPGTHTFRLRQVDTDGTVHTGPTTTVTVGMKAAYDVTAITPNPIRETGTVSVTVRESQPVSAAVYNVLGQRVRVLHDGPIAARDPMSLRVGSSLPSGVYFLRVRGESFSTTRKFVRVR